MSGFNNIPTDYNGGAIVEWSLFWLSSCKVVQSVLVDYFICIKKFATGIFFIRIVKFVNFICDLNLLGLVLVLRCFIFYKGHQN